MRGTVRFGPKSPPQVCLQFHKAETAMPAWFLHSSMGTSHSDAYDSVVHVVLSSVEGARTFKVQIPDGSGDTHATSARPSRSSSDRVAFPVCLHFP